MNQIGLFDPAAADAGKRAGIQRAIRNADQEWRRAVERAVAVLAERGVPFTSDDVRRAAGDPPAGTHPNAMGAIIGTLARAGVIRQAGYAKSARVIGHGNLVRRWTGSR